MSRSGTLAIVVVLRWMPQSSRYLVQRGANPAAAGSRSTLETHVAETMGRQARPLPIVFGEARRHVHQRHRLGRQLVAARQIAEVEQGQPDLRSEERRVGKECGSTGRTRVST